ncbi:MAG: Ig-like domain-containing protein, partial [Bacillus sp. (in: firmicutes)]
SNVQVPVLKTGDTLEAVGLSGAFAQGTRIRVRDTRELVGTTDTTAPELPVVKGVTEQDVVITGTTEAGAKVTARVSDQEIGSATADVDGKFSITIAKQVAGTQISVTATDQAGNESEAAEVTVSDVTAPALPVVSSVNDNDVVIKGTAEAGATIVAQVSDQKIGTATANTEGDFTMTIAKQSAGVKISVTATDEAGNVSLAANVTVQDEKVTKVSVTTVKPGTQVFKDPIQFTASSLGSRSPEYRFYILDKKGNLILLQDYGVSNKLTWTAKNPGTYTIFVEAKDKYNFGLSSFYYEARTELTFDVEAGKGKGK